MEEIVNRLANLEIPFRPGPPIPGLAELVRDARISVGLTPEPDRRTREALLARIAELEAREGGG